MSELKEETSVALDQLASKKLDQKDIHGRLLAENKNKMDLEIKVNGYLSKMQKVNDELYKLKKELGVAKEETTEWKKKYQEAQSEKSGQGGKVSENEQLRRLNEKVQYVSQQNKELKQKIQQEQLKQDTDKKFFETMRANDQQSKKCLIRNAITGVGTFNVWQYTGNVENNLLQKTLKMKEIQGNYVDAWFKVNNKKCEEIQVGEEKEKENIQTQLKVEKKKESKDEVEIKEIGKLKSDLQILKKQCSEIRKEKDLFEKLKLYYENYNVIRHLLQEQKKTLQLQNQLTELQNKTLHKQTAIKTQKQQMFESEAPKINDTILQLQEKIYELEEQNEKMERICKVDKEGEIQQLKEIQLNQEKQVKSLKQENQKLEYKVQNLLTKNFSPLQASQRLDTEKDQIITHLKQQLDQVHLQHETALQKQFALENSNLEHRFTREGFELQMQRMARRIKELEETKSYFESRMSERKLVIKQKNK